MKSLTCKEHLKKSLKNKHQKAQDREIRKQYKNPIDTIIQYMKNYALWYKIEFLVLTKRQNLYFVN
jgi:hypothetical protein